MKFMKGYKNLDWPSETSSLHSKHMTKRLEIRKSRDSTYLEFLEAYDEPDRCGLNRVSWASFVREFPSPVFFSFWKLTACEFRQQAAMSFQAC